MTCVLGPTNTGKTHLAVERMLGYRSGIIGLPLRLLAREIYDRVVGYRGAGAVALITGEEKIVPKHPRYFVCTVESMPLEFEPEFLAVDEIQLCADPERGHVFTNRLLHARGTVETMFLGAETMRPIIRQLLPDARFISRPRFSDLEYTGEKKLSRLPRRSAVVAFSADEVYGIAELIRRQRGGAAVVMGALSPRTRNAQVALYQSGEVDFMVATDAIGMGLNMDVDHVAFASLQKFDGVGHRRLAASEIAQIAGRAGRHMNDGTFGTTGEAGRFDEDVIDQVENHRFDPLRAIRWRNAALDFKSLARLQSSLDETPPARGLARARPAEDEISLATLAVDQEIARIAIAPAAVKRLWEVCQIPDFRKTMMDVHTRFLRRVYLHLMSDTGVLPEDWVGRHVERISRTDGDIDALATRIAHVRTWTFVANRSGWLADHAYWQGRTREIEDRLSDALHAKLAQRFIDRRTSVLMKRLQQKEELLAAVNDEADVLVEGEYVGRLNGFRFEADPRAKGVHARALRNAAYRALRSDTATRAGRLLDADDAAVTLTEHGRIWWEGHPVARLRPGHDALHPRVELLSDPELVDTALAQRLEARLQRWLDRHLRKTLEPLYSMIETDALDGLSRGLAFRLTERLGIVLRDDVRDLLDDMDKEARAALRRFGVRIGRLYVFMPALLKPAPARLKLLLSSLATGKEPKFVAPGPGLVSIPAERELPNAYYDAVGFRRCGERAIRIDMVERLLGQLYEKSRRGPFAITPDLMSPVGCSLVEFESVLRSLGYRPVRTRHEKSASQKTAAEVDETPVVDAVSAGEAATPRPPAPETVADRPPLPDAQKEASPEDAPSQTLWRRKARPRPAQRKNPKTTKTRTAKARTAEQGATGNAVDKKAPAADAARKPDSGRTGVSAPTPGESGRGKHTGKKKAKPRPAPHDPDSPFAALAELKKDLERARS